MATVLEDPRTQTAPSTSNSTPLPSAGQDREGVHPGDVIAVILGVLFFILLWLLMLADALSSMWSR